MNTQKEFKKTGQPGRDPGGAVHRISRTRLWLLRLIAVTIVPLLVFGVIEAGLRVAGYGYDPGFFQTIKMDGKDYFVPNPKFGYRFFPPAIARTAPEFRFPAEKSTNAYRIFLLGESAATGDPDSTYGVSRYLEVLLRERYPGIQFEVVCVAIIAIDSNTILPIARECVSHQGDLWLIYMGNNEMVGPFGAETSYGLRAPARIVIRAILAAKSTRVGQLLDSLIGRMRRSSTPTRWDGMRMFLNGRIGYNDPARLRAYENFKGNLEDILQAGQTANVPVVLSTMAVNLKDCAPMVSVHTPGVNTNADSAWNRVYEEGVGLEDKGAWPEALASYRKAAAIDPGFAEVQFRLGRCQLALSNRDDARRSFELARDYDALDFRSDTRINAVIREAAARHAAQGVHLLDAAEEMAANSPDGIPGLELFYEHVHFNCYGNYLLALGFAEQFNKLLPARITARDTGKWASADLCDRRLAVTVWDRERVWRPIMERITSPPFTGQFDHAANLKTYDVLLQKVRTQMASQTPEQARRMYEEAVAFSPDDYFLHGNFERFLTAGGFHAQAIVEAKRCCELVPQLPGGFYYTGTLLVRDGKIPEARDYFLRAIALDAGYAEALTQMGELLANQQDFAGALTSFNRAIRARAGYTPAYLGLGFMQERQGLMESARENYRKAAELEPEGPADYYYRAQTAIAAHRHDEAIACLRGVIKARPEFWQARYQLAVELSTQGDAEEARKQFSETIRYRPDFAPAHLSLGAALAAQGRADMALAEYRTAMRLDPGDHSARQQAQSLEANLNPGR